MKKNVFTIAAVLTAIAFAAAVMIYVDISDSSDAYVGDTFSSANNEGIQLQYTILTETDNGGTVCLSAGPAEPAAVLNIPSTATRAISPSENKTFDVVSIKDGAMNGNLFITGTVSIASSVTGIGNYAFNGCSNMTSVSIPNSVISIGEYAFNSCSSMEYVYLPDDLKIIESATFMGCSSLRSIVIPAEVASIESAAFSGCTSVVSVTGGAGLEKIKDNAFMNCQSIVAFSFGSSISYIGYSAFMNCTSLVVAPLPDSIASIGDSSFKNCSSLASVNIPSKLEIIENEMFMGCTALTDVHVVNGVRGIHENAFADSGLRTFTAPASLTMIGKGAFRGCLSLTEVSLIRSTVAAIPDEAFMGCTALGTVTTPAEAESIGANAFADTQISVFEVRENVTNIGLRAFYGCPLISISFPAALAEVGDDAFEGRTFVTSSGTEIVPVAANIAGSSFAYIGGKMVRDAYTVTYMIEGTPFGDIETYRAGSEAVLRSEPVREGYAFSGWSSPDTVLNDVFRMPRADVTITGYWIEPIGSDRVAVTGNTSKITSDATSVIIDAEASKKLAGSEEVLIALGSVSVGMDSGTFRSFAKNDAFDIAATSDRYSGPADDDKRKILESAVVYNFPVLCAGNGSPRGEIVFSVPYIPSDERAVKVYYTDAEGEFHDVRSEYTDGRIVFTYGVFGSFIIAEGDLNNEKVNSQAVLTLGGVLCAGMAAFIAYFGRKKY